MTKERIERLLNKKWVGQQLEKFWIGHGFKTIRDLAEKTGLTNLQKYADGQAFPRWENLVKIAEACNSDLAAILSYIDPNDSASTQDVHVPPEYRKVVRSLLEVLAKGPEEARDWLTGNIETFNKAYIKRSR